MRGPFPSGVLKYARACNPNRCLDGAGDRVATAASLRATTYRANAGSERSFLTKTPGSVEKRDRLPTGPDVSTATTRRHREADREIAAIRREEPDRLAVVAVHQSVGGLHSSAGVRITA